MMERNPLLETYLRQLHLPAFNQHYLSFATDAAQNNLDYPRYLLALVECQSSDVNAPPLFGNTAPAIFGNSAPPNQRMQMQSA